MLAQAQRSSNHTQHKVQQQNISIPPLPTFLLHPGHSERRGDTSPHWSLSPLAPWPPPLPRYRTRSCPRLPHPSFPGSKSSTGDRPRARRSASQARAMSAFGMRRVVAIHLAASIEGAFTLSRSLGAFLLGRAKLTRKMMMSLTVDAMNDLLMPGATVDVRRAWSESHFLNMERTW